MDFSTDGVLASVRLRAFLPDADGTFTNANLTLLLNEELQTWLTPIILEMRSEYLVTYQDIPLVSGQSRYTVPGGAVAGRVRLLQFVDASGNPQLPALQQVDPRNGGNSTAGTWGTFYMQDNSIVLQGGLPTGLFLRVSYERRVSECVSKSACAQITNISGNVVTVTGFPATMTAGVLVDFVKGSSPYSFLGTLTMPSPSGSTATFSGTLPTGLAVGDWVALNGQSPYPGIPQECIPVLNQWLTTKVLEIKADDKISVSEAKLKALDLQMRKVLAPRVLGNRKAPGSVLSAPVAPYFWPQGR